MANEKILLIDDEEDIRTVARMSLQMVGGFEVSEADSGETGLKMAKEMLPDLILLDAMMPGLDGPATLAKLRETPECREIAVVFLTAKAQRSELARLEALDVAGVMTKPFDPMEFSSRVRNYL